MSLVLWKSLSECEVSSTLRLLGEFRGVLDEQVHFKLELKLAIKISSVSTSVQGNFSL